MIFLKNLIPLIVALGMSLTCSLAMSQTSSKSNVRTTRLNFEDELIEGDISSPDLLVILKSKNANYGRLLKLRDHFLPEINETGYDILRGSK